MGIIKILDDMTIDKIAAGEVIEKPASIVKELVENSIDADAKEITVEIKNGGILYIRVLDTGKGMEYDDIENAFLRHATSKILSNSDLNKLNTLGFRGEALASIAAVSKVEMMSRTNNSEIGNKILIEGGNIILKEQCGCPIGTVITITDVFFNTPARLKFLKSESREGIYITEIMQNLALSHTYISFKYKVNGKLIFATKGDKDLKDVISVIYGKDITANIENINCRKDIISVYGFLGNSSTAKNNRNYQSLFVNGRYIKNKTISAAAQNAYKSMLTINKFPFFILHLYVNPEFIDVNVHPSKTEIKFQDDSLVFKAVFNCIKDTLLKMSLVPEIGDNKNSIISNIPKLDYSVQKFNIFDKTYNYDVNNTNESIEQTKTDVLDNFEDKKLNNKTPKFSPLAVVGQIHFTYIIAEGPDEMYLIDQHAAHERIYYEKYLEEYNFSGIKSQSLLLPFIIGLSINEKLKVLENVLIFEKLGYEIEDFGGNSISLRSIPVIFGNPDYKDVFQEIINLIENEKNILSSIDRIIYTMACKSAIKAGDKLNYKEMSELIDNLRFCENPYTCPHGRPTIIKMSYTELEKKFKRIQ